MIMKSWKLVVKSLRLKLFAVMYVMSPCMCTILIATIN